MTDKEKIATLVGFIKGTIGGHEYFAPFDVKAALNVLKEIR